MIQQTPSTTLFPYTTLFRSRRRGRARQRGPRAATPRRRGAPPGSRCGRDRKSTRLNSSHLGISYAVFCLKKKRKGKHNERQLNEATPGSPGCGHETTLSPEL